MTLHPDVKSDFFCVVMSLFLCCSPTGPQSLPGPHLGPGSLLAVYVTPGDVFRQHKICFHRFADNVQFYLPLRSLSKDAMQPLMDCLSKFKSWMSSNLLNKSKSKTDSILFGGHMAPTPRQITAVVQTGFFHLCLLARPKPYFPVADFKRVNNA